MKVLELNSIAGNHISSVCKDAVKMADKCRKPVHFNFNGTDVTVNPGEIAKEVESRWDRDYQAAAKALRESPKYKAEQKKRKAEDHAKRTASMKESATTEQEMREADVPWPQTEKQLREYIDSLVSRQHDYGTCVYAASMAATATFNYMGHVLGMTGFQASCADFDFLRRTRSIKGPFMLIKGEDALYPQYDLPGRLDKALEEWGPWIKEEAEKLLIEKGAAHPDVIAHWEQLAK
jgi:hypothetical protein